MNDAPIATPQIDAEEMRDAARRLLADRIDRRAPYAEPPRDGAKALFAAMVELGWTLLTLPAEMDGLGQSFAALAPIYEEMGKALSPVSLFPTMASLEILAATDAGDPAHLLAARIATGEAQVAIAMVRPDQIEGSQGCFEGVISSVPADSGVTHVLMVIEGNEPAAWLIDLAGEDVAVTRPEMWDRSRAMIDMILTGTVAKPVAQAPGSPGVARLLAHLDLALAWDSVGGARQSLEETVAYMMTRQQFGRSIGSFQALKHRVADHKVGIEIAAALVRDATAAFARGDQDAVVRAGQARLLANDVYHAMAEDSVQLHGGIGFTWEHDCHLFLKRSLLNEMLYSSPDQRRDRLQPMLFARAGRQQR